MFKTEFLLKVDIFTIFAAIIAAILELYLSLMHKNI